MVIIRNFCRVISTHFIRRRQMHFYPSFTGNSSNKVLQSGLGLTKLQDDISTKVNLSFREVTEKDFDDIMTLRMSEEQYNGRDYLADYYVTLLRTPEYKGYATMVNGKMVNFIFVAVLDAGKTMAVLSTHTCKEYYGKGILKSVVDNAVDQTAKNHPKLAYFSGVYNKEMYNDLVYPNVKRGFQKLVQKKDMLAYKIGSQNMIQNLSEQEMSTDIKKISQQDLEMIFQEESLTEIFPRNMVLCNWIPYECSTSNIPFICNERCTIFGTNMKRNVNKKQSLLTFGHYSRLPFALYYGIDVYGENISVLSDHVMAHLKTVKQFQYDEVTLAICYHDNLLNKQFCNHVTKHLGFDFIYADQQYCAAGYIEYLHKSKW